ncbi:GntR family transcriptional regulator [Modestobacter sp. Leaf380]|uniref:GntR family transcriptional regulator n=1 Tax=Modestobacter sp. Leaf380 TaxID=1736356 RepID=UPI0006FE9800|nr:GntR family transcriptional regulator [Modestobacter sp. Leaf380]KQS66282.1 GntR family transcriptional regulator [Modestobacter sp. Leaf380]
MSDPITRGPTAKHEQLRARLVELATQLPAGAALPSERRLCELHGVSRITVREAVGQLVAEGVLVRVPGSGTFVGERPARSRLHLASFAEDMRRMGLTPSTVVLGLALADPPPATRQALALAPDEPAWHLRRLRLADEAPMSVDDGWYAADVAPDLDAHDLTGSVYTLLGEVYGATVDRAEQSVRATAADPDTAVLLGLPAGAPVLAFDRVARSGGRPVEHTRSVYRGDRYEVTTTLELGRG